VKKETKKLRLLTLPRILIIVLGLFVTLFYISDLLSIEGGVRIIYLEIYILTTWLSLLLTIILKKGITLAYFIINLIGIIAYFVYIKYFAFPCGYEALIYLVFLVLYFIPSVILISVLFHRMENH